LGHEVIGCDLERCGKFGDRIKACQAAGFDALDGGQVDSGLLGQLALEERSANSPVSNARKWHQRPSRWHLLLVDRIWPRRRRAVDTRHRFIIQWPYGVYTASLWRESMTHVSGMWLWRLARVFAVLLISMALDTTPVLAQTRTAPEATQHALDELANCRAQRRPECATETPSPTLVPTASPSATWTPAPAVAVVEVPDAPTSTPTPDPCWLTDPDIGDPDNGYVVFDNSGAPVPCPTDGPTETPTPQPTDAPTSTSTPVVIVQQAPAPPAPAPQVAIQQQTVVVVQTVVVLVTPTRPLAAPTQTLRPSLTPTRTSTPSPTETVARTPTGTPTVVAIGLLSAPSRPASTAGPLVRWDWDGFLRTVAIVLAVVCVLVFVFSRRRVVAWRTRGQGGGSTNA
jgi:hypothetical protein